MNKEKKLRTIIKLFKRVITILSERVAELVKKEKTFVAFALAVRKSESSNRYNIVNSLGYLGAYQFGGARLCDLGYTKRIRQGWDNKAFVWKSGYSHKMFLGNPNFQDRVFKEHVINLLRTIDRKHKGSFGTLRNGVLITRSGCVAFAHLAGLGGLNNFLTTGFDPKDVSSGIPATTYMKKFANYSLVV